MKQLIKQLITMLFHPFIYTYYSIKGSKKLVIGRRMQIKSIKNIDIGSNVAIGRDSRFLCVREYAGQRYTPNIKIGDNVKITNRFTVLSAAPVLIDDNCLIASDVFISSENHGLNPEASVSYVDTPLVVKEVKIGKGCFIGEKAMIMPGVVLGDRVVVAAGAVVTESVPSFTMIAGIPARIIRKYNYQTHRWESNNEEKTK